MKKRILPITILIIMTIIIISSFSPHRHGDYKIIETPVLVEEWMTQPFDTAMDEEIVIEDWMTQPFNIN